MAASTVTGNTSIVLVSSINTKIYLSSVGYPGHIVTIKDYTGVASQGQPIVISTSQGVSFADGSFSTLLYNPYSYLTVASKTPNTWQILNNLGYLTTLSNAYVENLTSGNAYISLVSSVQGYVSSSVIGNVNVTRSLNLLGDVSILGDIIIAGGVDLFSTLNVKGNTNLSSALTVKGAVSFGSSLQLRDALTVSGSMSTANDLIVGGDLSISSALYVSQLSLTPFVSVQSLKMNTLNIGGGLLTAGNTTVGSNLFVGQNLIGLSTGLTTSSIQVLQSTVIVGDLTIQKKFTTSTLEFYSSGVVSKEVSASSLTVRGTVSTSDSLFLASSLTVAGTVRVGSATIDGNIFIGNNLTVKGNAQISTVLFGGNLSIGGPGLTSLFSSFTTSSLVGDSAIVYKNLTVTGATQVGNFISPNFYTFSNLSTGGNFGYMRSFLVGQTASVVGNLSVATSTFQKGVFSTTNLQVGAPFATPGNMVIQGNLFVNGPVLTSNIVAPIPIRVSTVSLSNTLSAITANIPIVIGQSTFASFSTFETAFSYSLKEILVGSSAKQFNLVPNPYVNVSGSANIRGEIFADDFSDPNPFVTTRNTFRKTFSTIRASTFVLEKTGSDTYVSSFIIGSNPFLNPNVRQSGYFVFGTSMYRMQVGSASNLNIYTYTSPFSGFQYANAAAFKSGTPSQWLLVGTDSNQLNTIQYSSDGVSWSPIVQGGFKSPFGPGTGSANDVIYMSTASALGPKWVATGVGATGAVSIQYSPDGSNWTNAGGTLFPNSLGYGNRLFYYPDPTNGTSGIILAGGYITSPSAFGILHSTDGFFWSQATGSGQFDCKDITLGTVFGASTLLAVGIDTTAFPTGNRIFKAGTTTYSSWTLQSNTPSLASGQYTSIAFGNGFFVLGTSASGSNSLYYSANNLATWTAATSGGFASGTKRVIFDSNNNCFIAVGSGSGGSNIQTSANGAVWITANYAFSDFSLSNLAFGQIPLPDTQSPYFTANVETRFQRAISSISIEASTIRASSIIGGTFYGNAAGITNMTKFGSRMFLSSITSRIVAVNTTYCNLTDMRALNLEVSSSAYLEPLRFVSTVSLWLGAGFDALSNGSIQATQNVINWSRASNANFSGYGSAVWGNGLPNAPFFVATGADADPARTIQYSRDGYTWTPVQSGGFTVRDEDGFYSGNTVSYATFFNGTTTYNRWLVGGSNAGTASTIFYSDDGSNFYAAQGLSPSFLLNSVQKIKTGNLEALALNAENTVLYTTNGSTWDTGARTLNAIGYGFISGYGFGWLGARNDTTGAVELWYSANGSSWSYASMNSSVQPITEMVYSSQDTTGYWIMMGVNSLYKTSDPINPSWSIVGNFIGGGLTQFESLFYNSTQGRWFAGGEAEQSIKTLWTSSNGITWSNITVGGFSSQTTAIGTGYSVLLTSSIVMVAGTGGFTNRTELKPQIFQEIGMPYAPSIYTSTLLTQSNTSNVFSTAVYGLAFTSSPQQRYPFVAIGDGIIPQKTIARSSNLSEWFPAITGGFSPAGYGAIYYSTPNLWLAVGDATASTATIQYSPDAANWFATNNSAAITLGGRAVAKFRNDHPTLPNRLVAVGRSPLETSGRNRTIAYSDNGTTWTESAQFGGGFVEAGYGLGAGFFTHPFFGRRNGMVAVGSPYTITSNVKTYSLINSIQYSSNATDWFAATSGGFEVAGYGVAYGQFSGLDWWIAVGENSNYGLNDTIKYSGDGLNWSNATSGAFEYAGYGVAYYPASNIFIAAGKSLSNTNTVIYSANGGSSWFPLLSTTSGFISQQSFGTAYGLFSQELITIEQQEFLNFPKAIVYSRANPLTYPTPSLRLLSTATILNEALTVNLSSQVMINTFTPVGSNTVTVNGDITASQFIYKGNEPSYANLYVSSIQVSTLQLISVMKAVEILTPSLQIGLNDARRANKITTANDLTQNIQRVAINDTLYSENPTFTYSSAKFPGWVGINISNPTVQLDVNGLAACSTLSTVIYKQSTIALLKANSEYIQNPNLSIFEGTNSRFITGKNTVYSAPSSITFNSILTVNLSTQKVGVYTSNPRLDLDVQTAGYFRQLSTSTVVSGTLFLTLQSL